MSNRDVTYDSHRRFGRRVVLSSLVLTCMSLLLTPRLARAEEPLPRVKVTNGTLATASGERLRGSTFFIDLYGVPDMRENRAEYRQYFDSIFNKHALNCVRICPWMGVWSYDLPGNQQHRDEYLYAIDTVVQWCETNGVYAIVNVHTQWNTPFDLEKSKQIWSLLAPRYKDRSHVIYELTNEPEPTSSLAGGASLYHHIKKLAPDTHQILFSHVAATQFKLDDMPEVTEGVDFSNASIGFHCYDSVLAHTVQWDHAQKLRDAGYPVICTEFVSLTNNNDMPISYDHLMHCMMRAEDREMAWISWGPFAQYRNAGKKDWTHEAISYKPEFEAALSRYGLKLSGKPGWPKSGRYRLQCLAGKGYLVRPTQQPWKSVEASVDDGGEAGVWTFQRFDGNIYRIGDSKDAKLSLHGNFEDDRPGQEVMVADPHADWNSQKFQLLSVGDGVFQVKCLWGDLYLTAGETDSGGSVRTDPLNPEGDSQKWRLIPVSDR